MIYEKIGHGLLREPFWSEGECFVSQKREGEIKKFSTFYEVDFNLKKILSPKWSIFA